MFREAFLGFFREEGHEVAGSAPLVPAGDATLLFTNAGMVPFKDAFVSGVPPSVAALSPSPHHHTSFAVGGSETPSAVDGRPYVTGQGLARRVTSAQRCVRAGGKHNDLDNVGFTPRHQTLFEMLGNFSFGDYFRDEAAHFAWTFLREELKLPADKLRVTVLEGDEATAAIWRKVAPELPEGHIVECGMEDNFWRMGFGAGPCGPCTEIFWDQGEGYGNGTEDDRWLEVWNLVLMQHNSDDDGNLGPLKAPSVDTGMGLERMASVLQGVPSNFETNAIADLITRIRHAVAASSGRMPAYDAHSPCAATSATRVIADHLRTASWLIAEGIIPSNVGRGYVLRRILRRATRYSHSLGVHEPLLGGLVKDFVETCSEASSGAVGERQDAVAKAIEREEQLFFGSLERGLDRLEVLLRRANEAGSAAELAATDAFELYDTYGFPMDLTQIVSAERGVALDMEACDALMEEQRNRGRAAWAGADATAVPPEVANWQGQGVAPRSVSYDHDALGGIDATIVAVQAIGKVELGGEDGDGLAWVAIDPCPFYAEGGGQIADTGNLLVSTPADGVAFQCKVLDVVRPYDGGIALKVQVPSGESLLVGSPARAAVDIDRRKRIEAHHTGTHILHGAIRRALGSDGVMQAGSFVGPDRFRFDFTHTSPVSEEILAAIEADVNGIARMELAVTISEMSMPDAKQIGALAQFGERYGDVVRVVHVGDAARGAAEVSTELCGGCHVTNTSELRPFKILREHSVAAGVRRIEAVCGPAALDWVESRVKTLQRVGSMLELPIDAPEADYVEKVERMAGRTKTLMKQVDSLHRAMASIERPAVASLEMDLSDTPVRVQIHVIDEAEHEGVSASNASKERGNAVVASSPECVHVVFCEDSIVVAAGDVPLSLGVSSAALIKAIASEAGGRGGGQDKFAQGKLATRVGADDAVRLVASVVDRSAK